MRRALESVYQIISSLSHSSGQGYFDAFVSEIANAVGADFVLVSGKDQAGLFFTVHAAYPASLDINAYSFPLADTPGEIAMQQGEAWFSDRTRQLFPHAAVLERCEVRAYAGVALKNAEGETIGLCSVMFKRAMPRMEKIVGLLRLLAPLAGRELALMYQQRQSQEPPAQPEHHHFLDTMMSHAPVGIGKVDLGGKILWANPAIEKMLGYSQEELQQLTVAEINHPDDWQTSIALYDALKRGERPAFTQEKRYLHRDGTVLWGRVTVTLIRNEQMYPDYLMVVLENIDPIRRHAEQLKLSHRVYDNLSEAILVCDADSRIISVNPAFEKITGYSEEEARGQRPSMLKSGLHDQTFYADMYHALERVGIWRGEVWNKRKNGKLYPQQLMISAVREGGKISQYIAIFSDLSQTKLAEQKIAAQANYDNLTGLPNRWLFGRCLARFCERGERFALMVLDLNNFKAVNNSMDHHVGDALLREVSDRLVSRVRTEDLVARIGGDEFAFLVPGIVNRRQAEVFAKQVIGGFARPFMLANQHLYVTATLGITLCPNDGGDSDELLRNAEQALFVAKRQGRSLGTYNASMREEVSQRHQMQHDLAEAIKLGQLTMAYQPIWDNRSGRVAKLEALVRWYHPHWGQVSPADFIPLAEEAGLIQGLGALVLWQSCRDLARLQQSGFPDLQMSINRSTLEFQTIDPEANEWLRVIRHFELDPADIIIEITESLLMETSDQHRVRIDALREAGCKLAIDDFGTGYSALNYLRTFPVDLVKIDRSFVRHIPFNEQDRLLLDGIINIVHNLGMQVVIEGVETREQLNFLCQKGCAFTQGYLLSRPLPFDDLTEYLSLNRQGMNLANLTTVS
ncbi:GGDEF domain-containing protein [Aeromonas caviae]|uniref:putative bifunctional diguanylate cyclase/phosphodiesterase n=1 Tax=Aeromonas TaxID=642 RepID=UPI0011638AA2|nr:MULTISPECIES: GGDEF domain-containing phosphodiesterase [Aeromonas]MBP4066685.1 EAL domain-containing protein [Aeromonas sp. MaB10011B]MBP4080401.1 EAL domain-containing protein [Aeromonas sp. MrichA-1]QDO77621.1 EAL domain-containing protein [Aeromonas caviae]WEE21835.1 EAL domain-containing protein [Aeromonas caviae]GKQ66100.1 GGDEF domain-containing protein [Aeromonas caviae]